MLNAIWLLARMKLWLWHQRIWWDNIRYNNGEQHCLSITTTIILWLLYWISWKVCRKRLLSTSTLLSYWTTILVIWRILIVSIGIVLVSITRMEDGCCHDPLIISTSYKCLGAQRRFTWLLHWQLTSILWQMPGNQMTILRQKQVTTSTNRMRWGPPIHHLLFKKGTKMQPPLRIFCLAGTHSPLSRG